MTTYAQQLYRDERAMDREERQHAAIGEIWNPATHTWEEWLEGLGAFPDDDDDLGDDPDTYADQLLDEALGVR